MLAKEQIVENIRMDFPLYIQNLTSLMGYKLPEAKVKGLLECEQKMVSLAEAAAVMNAEEAFNSVAHNDCSHLTWELFSKLHTMLSWKINGMAGSPRMYPFQSVLGFTDNPMDIDRFLNQFIYGKRALGQGECAISLIMDFAVYSPMQKLSSPTVSLVATGLLMSVGAGYCNMSNRNMEQVRAYFSTKDYDKAEQYIRDKCFILYQ